MNAGLLEVDELHTYFRLEDAEVRAVDGVSFALGPGKGLGIVGESGCGKSVTALSLLGLLQKPPAHHPRGSVRYRGKELLGASEAVLRQIRGNRISMIFQDPMTSLNPYLTIERQLSEVLEVHRGLARAAARDAVVEMLERVGIPDAGRRMHDFPHQFSGGMRQRVMIAMALLCEPEVLIADEPTTALDVTIQAQILDLVRGLQRERGTSVILITHDLGVVAGMADELLVMYAGRVVEAGPTEAVFAAPRHPYTRALLASVPRLEGDVVPLSPIPGLPPDLASLPAGCAFAPRCPRARDVCRERAPELEVAHTTGHLRCFNPEAAEAEP